MNNQLRALIVEDSRFDAEFISRALREVGFELTDSLIVDDPVRYEKALTERSWDIVISDYVMPTFNGTEALEIFKRHKLDIPFICVSGGIGEEKAAEVVRAGANNYVSKSHLARLGSVVRSEIAAAVERRSNRKVAELAAHLAAIVEGTDDAICSRDMAGTILSWNSAAERMYGYTAAEAIGKHISLVVPPTGLDELDGVLEKLVQGKRIAAMETTRKHKDGHTVEVSMTISPIKDDQDQVIGVSVIARDITEKKRMEQERLALIEQLQKAMSEVKQLSGLLPICANCKRIRDEKGGWQQVEVYVHAHSQADFTHSICPDCTQELYPEIYRKLQKP